MQMFNGLTMGIFSPYMVKLELEAGSGSPEQESANPNETLTKIESIIANGIDDTEKSELENVMDEAFFTGLKAYLEQNGKVSDGIKDSLVSILNTNKNENDKPYYKNLVKLAEEIGLKENSGTWSKKTTTETETPTEAETNENQNNTPKEPDNKINLNLNGITQAGQEGKQTGNKGLHSGLTRDIINEGQEINEDKNLYKTIQDIKALSGRIDSLLSDENLQGNKNLTNTKNGLKSIQDVIDNPTKPNVQKLQKYIYDNLDNETDEDKVFYAEFKEKNKDKRDKNEFDGLFGETTLKGLNKVLKKTENYINEMENYSKDVKISKVEAPATPVTVKKGTTNPKELLKDLNLPEDAQVTFSNDNQAKAELATPGEHSIDIKITIPNSNYEKTITVSVKVEEDKPNTPDNVEAPKPKTTEPLKLGDKTYQVVGNANEVYKGLGSSAVLYTMEPFEGPDLTAGENGQYATVDAMPNTDGDNEYYAKLDNSGSIYKIKLDKNGCICPTARNVTGNNVPVMFEGDSIPSCVNYLNNKLPSELQNKGIIIKWDGEDYIITMDGYKDYTTIEPMTIDGFWLRGEKSQTKTSLTGNLALLNFTNFLFNKQKLYDIDFVNDNPNLKFEDNKLMVRVNKKSNTTFDEKTGKIQRLGKRLPVNRAEFGIDGKNITDDQLKKFVKYNNHEDWNDNWDKKRYNKNYRHVKLS